MFMQSPNMKIKIKSKPAGKGKTWLNSNLSNVWTIKNCIKLVFARIYSSAKRGYRL